MDNLVKLNTERQITQLGGQDLTSSFLKKDNCHIWTNDVLLSKFQRKSFNNITDLYDGSFKLMMTNKNGHITNKYSVVLL